MKSRTLWRRIAVIAGLVVAANFVFLLIAATIVWLLPAGKRPTDSRLVASFSTNRVVFEELRDMMRTNPALGRISAYFINRTNSVVECSPYAVGISEDQCSRYRELLRRGSAKMAIHKDDQFRFLVAGWGWAGEGWRIAVVYSTNAPSPLIPSLDDFHRTKSEWEEAYRPLGDNWYLWIIW